MVTHVASPAGLSPPTRGSRLAAALPPRMKRSIPAHTGKPRGWSRPAHVAGVYPRPHGEANPDTSVPLPQGGLSPPTRGSQNTSPLFSSILGSIPAHTGKPARSRLARAEAAVYPRPHGEAGRRRPDKRCGNGLSPPTRGSHGARPAGDRRCGSIPAHTGKPRRTSTPARRCGVYPRPHGEATEDPLTPSVAEGLSPPTRGSLRMHRHARPPDGSIPAHTGKPCPDRRCAAPSGVYPRPHGEAVPVLRLVAVVAGLSPPTRGSPVTATAVALYARSIPAHTGKPGAAARWTTCPRVYPRPHGEASARQPGDRRYRGLSPPTRGSLVRPPAVELLARSIPAHTGKPKSIDVSYNRVRVYPRPHGEATRKGGG